MKIEIDQSGRMEETSRDTVIAFANGVTFSVRITGRAKRKLQDVYRRNGEPKTYMVNAFACAIFLLIESKAKSITEIVIDQEYPGYETAIKTILRKIFETKKLKNPPEINFVCIGKRSTAHKVALKTFQKRRKADKIITFEVIYNLAFTNKNGRPVLTYPGGKAR